MAASGPEAGLRRSRHGVQQWSKLDGPLSVAIAQKLPFDSAGKNGGAL
jgi:hypothetical protein